MPDIAERRTQPEGNEMTNVLGLHMVAYNVRDIRGSVRTCAHNLTVCRTTCCTPHSTPHTRVSTPPTSSQPVLCSLSPGTPHSNCALPSPRVLAGTGVQVSKTCTSPTCEPRAAQFTTSQSDASLSHLQSSCSTPPRPDMRASSRRPRRGSSRASWLPLGSFDGS